MKTVLLTTIVLMSIHTAFSKYIFYDNLNNCIEDIFSNKIASGKIHLINDFLSFKLKNSYEDLPREVIINALICAFKKDGLINKQGGLAKDTAAQYCAPVFTTPDKVEKCQTISNFCFDLECRGAICTRTELLKFFDCTTRNHIMSLVDSVLHAVDEIPTSTQLSESI